MRHLRRLSAVVAWVALVGVAGLLVVMVLVPRLTGWVPLTVLTGSMEPAIPAGSMVVVERIDGEADLDRIQIGDVITFLPRTDDPHLVTHRVVGEGGRSDGSTVFTTRGDANGADDREPVGATQIRGRVRYHVPGVGHVSQLLNVEQKRLGVIVVAGVLFLYAGGQVVRAVRRRPSAGSGQPAEDGSGQRDEDDSERA
ncbi:signal peptidase I [Ornithinimicrobium cavernae]|uniref:signal peptidase I n=1 Tax=Ornithinimicrobium cavernae TaxID=2666047 RepID=UPI000D698002|nr:signal peptidase I [Ornithinimicrobium cavernae]